MDKVLDNNSNSSNEEDEEIQEINYENDNLYNNDLCLSGTSFGSNEQSENQNFDQHPESENKKFDIYNFLSDPNPLMEKQNSYKYEINTALNIQFKQLPDLFTDLDEITKCTPFKQEFQKENYQQTTSIQNQNPYSILNEQKNKEKSKQTIDAETQQQQWNLKPRNLFNMYRDNDKIKLIYDKYENGQYQQFQQQNSEYFASYICDLRTMLEGNKPTNQLKFVINEKNDANSLQNQTTQKLFQFNNNNNLVFDSRFESGNLFKAFKIGENDYDLILQNDINTRGYTQWFFFSVQNTVQGQSTKFNIVNLTKNSSLFQLGMKPCVFSIKRRQQQNITWQREGFNISYYKNNIMKEKLKDQSYYSLSFQYCFEYSQDTVYFAYSFPYTYTYLNTYLENLLSDPQKNQHVHRRIIATSIVNNKIDCLTITSSKLEQADNKRKSVVFLARQHPGEVTGSFMIQGVIDFLTGSSREAEYLREQIQFKILPMINVDGVVHGNNRCSLLGQDLNRRWQKTSPKLHPCIFQIKNMIQKLSHQREIQMVVDFHGHSKKLESFFYGNNYTKQPELTRLFPLLTSQVDSKISFKDCRFRVDRQFEQTARMSLWRMTRNPNVFTLESSFYGYFNQQENAVKHYTPTDYKDIGKSVCISLFKLIYNEKNVSPKLELQFQENSNSLYQKNNQTPTKNENDFLRIQKKNQQIPEFDFETIEFQFQKDLETQKNNQGDQIQNLLEELQNKEELIKFGEKDDFSGSDSSPDKDEADDDIMQKILPKTLINQKNNIKKKKKLKKSKQNKQILEANNNQLNCQAKQDNAAARLTPSKSKLSYRHASKSVYSQSNYQQLLSQQIQQKKKIDKNTQTIENFDISFLESPQVQFNNQRQSTESVQYFQSKSQFPPRLRKLQSFNQAQIQQFNQNQEIFKQNQIIEQEGFQQNQQIQQQFNNSNNVQNENLNSAFSKFMIQGQKMKEFELHQQQKLQQSLERYTNLTKEQGTQTVISGLQLIQNLSHQQSGVSGQVKCQKLEQQQQINSLQNMQYQQTSTSQSSNRYSNSSNLQMDKARNSIQNLQQSNTIENEIQQNQHNIKKKVSKSFIQKNKTKFEEDIQNQYFDDKQSIGSIFSKQFLVKNQNQQTNNQNQKMEIDYNYNIEQKTLAQLDKKAITTTSITQPSTSQIKQLQDLSQAQSKYTLRDHSKSNDISTVKLTCKSSNPQEFIINNHFSDENFQYQQGIKNQTQFLVPERDLKRVLDLNKNKQIQKQQQNVGLKTQYNNSNNVSKLTFNQEDDIRNRENLQISNQTTQYQNFNNQIYQRNEQETKKANIFQKSQYRVHQQNILKPVNYNLNTDYDDATNKNNISVIISQNQQSKNAYVKRNRSSGGSTGNNRQYIIKKSKIIKHF